MSVNDLQRFTFFERVVHWVVGISFVMLLLTGLAFSYRSLFWLTIPFGGGAAARVLHPWTGVVFEGGLVLMFFLWWRDMFLVDGDSRWLKAVRHYAAHDETNGPEVGKYNAGQKIFFWLQSLLGVVFLVTGVPLWMAGSFGADILRTMRLLHFSAAAGGGLRLIVHAYLGTVAFPGTARGMLWGSVTREWGKLHHALWAREQSSE